nr:MAG TPA: hypothetical protein [Caudoviricetes sp.]
MSYYQAGDPDAHLSMRDRLRAEYSGEVTE